MPALRVDWQSIKGAVADVAAPYVFVIPDGSRHLFLAIADKLSWEATYRAHDYDYSDWDELQAVHDAGVDGLLGGVPLDAITGRLDSIIGLLQAADYCCNAALEDETVESDFSSGVPGETTPPTVWGDAEPVADTDDWAELVCGAANAYVDHLISMANQIDRLLSIGSIGLGVVASILGLLSGAGIVLAISYGAAAGAVGGLADLVGSTLFGDAAADLEDARSDIVCAVRYGDLGDAVQSAVSSTVWTAFFQWVNYSAARNVMLEGSHGSEYLDVNRMTTCVCDPPTTRTWTFDSGQEGWQRGDSVSGWSATEGDPDPGALRQQTSVNPVYYRSPDFGAPAASAVALSFRTRHTSGGTQIRMRLRRSSDDAVIFDSSINSSSGAWHSGGASWGSLPADTYYLHMGGDNAYFFDTVTLEFTP